MLESLFNEDAGPNVPLLYPLKTSENLWFSDVFKGYGSGKLGPATLLKRDSNTGVFL